MASLLLFSIFDEKVGAFGPPFISSARGEAIRTFSDICREPNLPYIKHVGDYCLYCIGTYDNVSGALVGNTPERMLRGDEIGE